MALLLDQNTPLDGLAGDTGETETNLRQTGVRLTTCLFLLKALFIARLRRRVLRRGKQVWAGIGVLGIDREGLCESSAVDCEGLSGDESGFVGG